MTSAMDPFALPEIIARKERELDVLRRELSLLRTPARLPQGAFPVLRCGLGRYAIALLASEVEEVLRMVELTPLPAAPPWIPGLLSLGARRLPVVDLIARESGSARAVDPSEFIVVTTTERGTCALLVESVEGLSSVDSTQVQRPSLDMPFGAHVLGVTTLGEQSVLLVTSAPLNQDELAVEVGK